MGFARWCLFIVVSLGLSFPGGVRWHVCGCGTASSAATGDESADEPRSCCSESSSESGGSCTETGVPCERCKVVGVERHALASVVARPAELAPLALARISAAAPILVAPAAIARLETRDASAVPRPPGAAAYLPLRC